MSAKLILREKLSGFYLSVINLFMGGIITRKLIMRHFLLSLAGKYQVIVITVTTIILAFIIATIFSLFFDEHKLVINVDLIASIYQVMGTIYAILLTFTLWGVWQKFTEAEASVKNEAYSLLDLVHILETSASWKKDDIRHAALDYAKRIANQEWPSLKHFTSNTINGQEHHSHSSLHLIQAVQSITPKNERDTVIFGQALTLLNHWLDARRSRMLAARGNTARALWPLLLTGAFVLFAFHGLFVTQTIGIWSTLLLGTSLVIGLTFYLIFTLDCPFEGTLSIDAEPFTLAINILESNK